MRKRVVSAIALTLLFMSMVISAFTVTPGVTASLSVVPNSGFEEGVLGQVPTHWTKELIEREGVNPPAQGTFEHNLSKSSVAYYEGNHSLYGRAAFIHTYSKNNNPTSETWAHSEYVSAREYAPVTVYMRNISRVRPSSWGWNSYIYLKLSDGVNEVQYVLYEYREWPTGQTLEANHYNFTDLGADGQMWYGYTRETPINLDKAHIRVSIGWLAHTWYWYSPARVEISSYVDNVILVGELCWKEPYPDYAPSGMPDFSQKQDNWGKYHDTNITWTWCGPTAVANCLWWIDSRFEPNAIPPPTYSDGFPLVESYDGWDDHDPQNVPPLIQELAWYMDCDGNRTNPCAWDGTYVDDMTNGINEYIRDKGLEESLYAEMVETPEFDFIEDEVERCEDVILLVGFWQRGEEVKDQYQEECEVCEHVDTYWNSWQEFVPTATSLSRVEVKIARTLGEANQVPINMTIESPLGNVLTSATHQWWEVPELLWCNTTWISFDVPDIPLTPGQSYYIVLDSEPLAYHWCAVNWDAYPPGQSNFEYPWDWTFRTFSPAGWTRLGGHYLTVAGVDSENWLLAVSDPYIDWAEPPAYIGDPDRGNGPGRVIPPPPHGHPTQPPSPTTPDTVHNNATYVSHDIYRVTHSESPGGTWQLEDYISSKEELVENMAGQNCPREFLPDTGGYIPGEPVYTEIEYAVVVSPIQLELPEKFGPRADRLLIKLYQDAEDEWDALDAGEIDITDRALTKPYYDKFTTPPENERIDVKWYGPEQGLFLLDMNWNNNPYLGNPPDPPYPNPIYPNPCSCVNMRKAIWYLHDKPTWLPTIIGEGFYADLYTVVPPCFGAFHLPMPNPYPYSLAGAIAELESDVCPADGASDFPMDDGTGHRYWDLNGNGAYDGGDEYLELIFVVRSDDVHRMSVANKLIAQLNAIGIRVDAKYGPEATANTWWFNGKAAHLYTAAWSLGVTPDHLLIWNSNFYWHPGVCYNTAFVNDAILDDNSSAVRTANTEYDALMNCIDFQFRFAQVAAAVPWWSYSGSKAVYRTYTGGTGGTPVNPDDGENQYRGRYWDGIVNVEGYGPDNYWSLLNMHPRGVERGDCENMTIRYGFSTSEIRSFNPIYATEEREWQILGVIYDTLLKRDPCNLSELMPWIASHYEVGTYMHPIYGTCSKVKFTLRPDVYWADGTPLTTADVEFTLVDLDDILLNRGLPPPWWYANVKNILDFKIYDAYNFEVLFNVESIYAAGWLGDQIEMAYHKWPWGTPILPKHIWKPITEEGDPTGTTPDPNMIGSGPWRFKEYLPYSHVLMVANKPNSTVTTSWLSGEVKDQYQEECEVCEHVDTYWNSWQEFVPTATSLSRVEVKIARTLGFPNLCPINMTVESPVGNVLTSATRQWWEIPELLWCNTTWISFDVPDIPLTPGQSYYIRLDSEPLAYHWCAVAWDAYPPGQSNFEYPWDWTFKTFYGGAERKDQCQELCEECDHVEFSGLGYITWQEFVPTATSLSRVEVKIARTLGFPNLCPINMTVESPVGNVLTSATRQWWEIPELLWCNTTWISFDVPDIPLTPGQSYYIRLSTQTDCWYHWCGVPWDAYPPGNSSFQELAQRPWDWTFRTFYWLTLEGTPVTSPWGFFRYWPCEADTYELDRRSKVGYMEDITMISDFHNLYAERCDNVTTVVALNGTIWIHETEAVPRFGSAGWIDMHFRARCIDFGYSLRHYQDLPCSLAVLTYYKVLWIHLAGNFELTWRDDPITEIDWDCDWIKIEIWRYQYVFDHPYPSCTWWLSDLELSWHVIKEDIVGSTWYDQCDKCIRPRLPPEMDTFDFAGYVYKRQLSTPDNKVDIKDVATAAKAFGSYPGHERWSPYADITCDCKIDIKDIAAIAKKFGWIG